MVGGRKSLFHVLVLSLMLCVQLSCSSTKEQKVQEGVNAPMEMGKDTAPERKEAAEHFKLARNYLRNGDLDRARDEAQRAVLLDPQHPVPHLLLGDIYYQRQEYQRALEAYERARALDSSKGLPYAKIGRVYIKLGMEDKALEALQTAVRLDSEVPVLHRKLADLYSRMGYLEEAAKEYEKAEALSQSGAKGGAAESAPMATRTKGRAQVHPGFARVMKLGDEFLKEGFFSLAIEQFQIAVRLDPESAIAHQKVGDGYMRKGMLAEALAQYRKVRELEPDSPLSYLGMGVVHSKKFETDEAVSLFNEGLALNPDFAPLHFELAMAYVKEDRLDEAILELEKTVALDSKSEKPKEILKSLKKEKKAEEGFVTIENQRFILEYDPGLNENFVQDVVQSLEKADEKLVKDLAYDPQERTIVKLYPDLKEFHLAASTPQWFRGGVAATRDRKILLATPKRQVNIDKLPQVITHELSHVFTNLITYGNHPGWVNEGIAVYEAGQWDEEKETVLRQAVYEDNLLGLGDLEKPFTRFHNPRQIELAYAESYTAVAYILNRYGREALVGILREFSRGKTFDEAARDVLGMNMAEFEEGWRDYLSER